MKLHVNARFLPLAAAICAPGMILTACTLGGTPHPSRHGVADTADSPAEHHAASGPYVRTETIPPVIADVPSAPASPTAPGAGSPSQPDIPPVRSMVRLLGPARPEVLHHDVCTGVSFAGPHATRDPQGRWVRFSDQDFTSEQLAVRSAVGIGGISTEGYNIAAWMAGDRDAAMASLACKTGR